MKRNLLIALFIFVAISTLPARDFSSEILQVNSAGFPKISLVLKVFNKEPAELRADSMVINEDATGISSFELSFQKNRHYMVLVIDRSSSIEPAMNEVKRAAASFVESMVSDVSMSVLSFGSDIDFAHSFSSDGQSLVAAIAKLRPWGGTALYDAIYTACEELQNKAGRTDLKTVVCLTDGHDSTPNGQTPMSTHTPAEVTKLATEKGVRLITVGLGNDIDESVLKSFADATGGWYLQTTTPEQLSKLYEALSRRMKMERYYQLNYTTPRPEPDGTRREILIISKLKGQEDQGKGHYTAPTRTAHKPERSDDDKAGKMSARSLDFDLKIDGPDSVFLTDPIIPPPPTPVFGLTTASLLGLSQADALAVIEQTRVRVSAEHRKNYEIQQHYLDGYHNGIASLSAKVEASAASPDLKDFERPRIDYRRQYLQMRKEELELHSQRSYDEYLARHTAAMAELDYFQQAQLSGDNDHGDFFHTNAASLSAALDVIDEKYDKLLDLHRDKASQHYTDTFGSRGAHVEHSTTVTEYETDMPQTPDMGGSNRPSIKNIKKYIHDRVPGADEDDYAGEDDEGDDDGDNGDDDDNENNYDESSSEDLPGMPDLKILDN